MTPPDRPERATRRVALIDLDWQDLDLLPALLGARDVRVGLVAGARDDDAGVRAAALCGLPRTTELGDLAREIFDVALLGERSPRHERVERLLRALGTPVESPTAFLHEPAVAVDAAPPPAIEVASLPAVDAAPPPAADIAPPVAESPVAHSTASEPAATPVPAPAIELAGVPARGDAGAIADALAAWVLATSAAAATLLDEGTDGPPSVTRAQRTDALLEALVERALELDAPAVLTADDGRLWGAWPFAAAGSRAVLGVAGAAAPGAREAWGAAADAVRVAWTRAAASGLAMLAPGAFSRRLSAAVASRRAGGPPFTVQRLVFDGPAAVIERALAHVTTALDARSAGGCACRTAPGELLLLVPGDRAAFARTRARLDGEWRGAWTRAGGRGAAPVPAEEPLEIAGAAPAAAESLTPERAGV